MRKLAALLLALLLTACSDGSGIDGVRRYEVAKGHTEAPVTYPQTPPAGGPHSERWLRCGVYDEPVPDENAVHSMEHGAVWLTYRPDLPAADVTAVKRLQGLKPAYVLISPYPGLPSPVVASAWGLQLPVDRADDPRLGEFVKTYAGGDQGGEPGTRCDDGWPLDALRP